MSSMSKSTQSQRPALQKQLPEQLMESLAGGYRLIGSLPILLEIKGIMQTAHLPTPRARLRAARKPRLSLSSGELQRAP